MDGRQATLPLGPVQERTAERPPPRGGVRVTVDGKAFARGGQRTRVQGVTYGPFAPDAEGEQFPNPERVADDFARMRAGEVNAVRTYHVPPEWFLDLADQQGINVLIDVPWPKHLCFLDSKPLRTEARRAVRQAALRGRNHPCLLGYSVGNEIRPDMVRWYGRRPVERFLAQLRDEVKQADPEGLVTYASYPPTEYLDVWFLDFVTFNVYLHDRETFRRYLFRLQHLAGDRPLVLGELGMDTLRHGEQEQAEFLAGHVREARLMGLAGAFVFSWTDEWFTGGHPIANWAFGITDADRTPKASYHALRETFERTPAQALAQTPRVSVVVCTYNGGATLDQCLRSLLALDYPDYEVIVVDDGSTDDTRAIVARFPSIRVIHQSNQGLSAARNVGLHASTGDIIAYTDSDCFADPDWLTHLVYQLQRSGAHAVGGPNLTPEDGWLAGCVAACPGQPAHVLESDQVAEHIPGCNMAFRREALEAIKGFDRIYRQAGDDVDLCWRLQQAGMWITFAPGGFVWHHRRQGPRAYLRQQAGYGRAEALLQFKHPDQFNHRGNSRWRGVLYGGSVRGLQMTQPIIYRGTFATGFFQSLYQPGPAHWAMLAATLEWQVVAGLVGLFGCLQQRPAPCVIAAVMLGMSLLVAALQAVQARVAPQHDGLLSRLLIGALCYVQPLVRSWARYKAHFFAPAPQPTPLALQGGAGDPLPLTGRRTVAYWTEKGYDRAELLGLVVAYLNELRWAKVLDTGWTDWDLRIYGHSWTSVQVCTTQEEHGGGKTLIRVRYLLRLRALTRLLLLGALASATAALVLWAWRPLVVVGAFLAVVLGAWVRGTYVAARAVSLVDHVAKGLGLVRCEPHGERPAERAPADAQQPVDSMASVLRALQQGEASARESTAAIAPIPSFVLQAVKRRGSEETDGEPNGY